jgi:hypothetical protein
MRDEPRKVIPGRDWLAKSGCEEILEYRREVDCGEFIP